MCDLQLWKVINSLSESILGVLGLYGKPIESRVHPYSCGGLWVTITLLKYMFLYQVCRLHGYVEVNSREIT